MNDELVFRILPFDSQDEKFRRFKTVLSLIHKINHFDSQDLYLSFFDSQDKSFRLTG